jgi:hypothetical protein
VGAKKPKLRQTGARIDAETYRQLRILAAKRDTTFSALLEEGARLVIAKYRKGRAKP